MSNGLVAYHEVYNICSSGYQANNANPTNLAGTHKEHTHTHKHYRTRWLADWLCELR